MCGSVSFLGMSVCCLIGPANDVLPSVLLQSLSLSLRSAGGVGVVGALEFSPRRWKYCPRLSALFYLLRQAACRFLSLFCKLPVRLSPASLRGEAWFLRPSDRWQQGHSSWGFSSRPKSGLAGTTVSPGGQCGASGTGLSPPDP